MLAVMLAICDVLEKTEQVILENSVWFYFPSKANFQGYVPRFIIPTLKTL